MPENIVTIRLASRWSGKAIMLADLLRGLWEAKAAMLEDIFGEAMSFPQPPPRESHASQEPQESPDPTCTTSPQPQTPDYS